MELTEQEILRLGRWARYSKDIITDPDKLKTEHGYFEAVRKIIPRWPIPQKSIIGYISERDVCISVDCAECLEPDAVANYQI